MTLSTEERVAILKQVSIFAAVGEETLAGVARLLAEVRVRAFEKIFDRGETGDSMYVIVDGRVRVHDGVRLLNYLGPREVFGEMAVLSSEPRVAAVTAVEESLLLRLDLEPFHELMARRGEVALGIVRVLCERLRARVEDLSELRVRYEALEATIDERNRDRAREALHVYLPMDRRVALVSRQELPERGRGAVLFADISGFTPLTEALARELGPRQGAEELTRQLNRVYGALIGEVHQGRGSVIGFSGDAITCWFDGDDGGRAVVCALSMQRVMSGFAGIETPSGFAVTLGIKTAVTCGAVRRFLVGDPEIQLIDVLAGATLDRMAAAEDLAENGEVVVGPQVVAELDRRLIVQGWREEATWGRFAVVADVEEDLTLHPWPTFHPDKFDEAELKPWLLPPVYDRLRSGQGEFLAELRPAAALFLRWSGLDFDADEAVGGKLDRYIRWVQKVIERYEGSLIQLTTGDKGSYLYAAFGAPIAHEDAAERAVAAALVLRSPPPEMAFITGVRMGLSQGRMRTGAYGGESRRTYGVLGDETNLAARLMGKAEAGQILVSGRIAAAVKASYKLRSLGPMTVKGKSEAIPVSEVRGRRRSLLLREARGERAAMVGRQEERRLLAERLEALGHEGASATVVLEGEAGIGKSRLIADLLEKAREPHFRATGVESLLAVADAVEHSTAHYAWRPVFQHLFEVESAGDDLEAQRRHARDWVAGELGEEAVELAPLLNTVLPVELPETALTASLQGRQRADRTHELLVRILRHGTHGHPVLLLVEDAQWLDSASWALLGLVRRKIRPLLMVLATRPIPAPVPKVYAQLLQSPSASTLELKALAPAETVALVCHRLGVESLPEPVTALIRDKAEGNPFFSEELAYALRDSAVIRIEGGVCHLERDLGELDFPTTIEGVVTSRIDRLAPSPQLALKVASVIGRVFFLDTLRDVFPVESERRQLSGFVTTLAQLGLTPVETPEPKPSYIFKHAITHEVAYNLMLYEQRRQLHRAVAEWYEAHHHDDLAPFYALLAHHWSTALGAVEQADPAALRKAIDYLGRAGGQALANSANLEAKEHLTRALELLEHFRRSPRRQRQELELRSHLGAALVATQGYGAAEVAENFARARQLLGQVKETRQLLPVLHALLVFHLTRSDRQVTVELAAESERFAIRLEDPSLMVSLGARLGFAALLAGDHQQAQASFAAALEHYDSEGHKSDAVVYGQDPGVAAEAYRGLCCWYLGQPERARTHAERAIARAEEISHPASLGTALLHAALVHQRRREAAETRQLAERLIDLAAEHSFSLWLALATSLKGWSLVHLGEVEEGVLHVLEGLASWRVTGARAYFPTGLSYLADAFLALGMADDGLAAVDEALELVENHLDRCDEAELYRLKGELLAAAGSSEGAEENLRRALAVARAQQAKSLELRAAVSLGRRWREAARTDEAEELVAAVYGTFTEGFDTADLADARAFLGEPASTPGGGR